MAPDVLVHTEEPTGKNHHPMGEYQSLYSCNLALAKAQQKVQVQNYNALHLLYTYIYI